MPGSRHLHHQPVDNYNLQPQPELHVCNTQTNHHSPLLCLGELGLCIALPLQKHKGQRHTVFNWLFNLFNIYIFMNWLIGSNAKMSPNTRLDSSVKASYSILPHPCTSSFPRLLLDSRQPQDTEKVPSFGRMCPGSHQNAPTSNYLCQQFHCESNVIQLLIWVNRSIL